jgi:hypothetical protein
MNDYSLGKDIATLLDRIASLEAKVDELLDECPRVNSDIGEMLAPLIVSLTNESQSFPMKDLQAGPGFIRGSTITAYANGLWQVQATTGNESRHSYSRLDYYLQIRNSEGTVVLLELIMFSSSFGPRSSSPVNKAGVSAALASYFNGLKSGEFKMFHRLHRERTG